MRQTERSFPSLVCPLQGLSSELAAPELERVGWLFTGNMLRSRQFCVRLAGVLESVQVLRPQMTTLEFSKAFQWAYQGGGMDGCKHIFRSVRNSTAFKNVQELKILEGENLTTDAFHGLGSALGKDALPNLELLFLWKTPFRSDYLAAFFNGLEHSACAHPLRTLCLSVCGICPKLEFLNLPHVEASMKQSVTEIWNKFGSVKRMCFRWGAGLVQYLRKY